MNHRMTGPTYVVDRRWVPFVVLLALLVSTGTAVAQVQVQPPIGEACAIQIDPTPSGVLDRPGDSWGSGADYFWMHSSTHLQGRLATEKFAPGLFYLPAGDLYFSGVRSAIVVNNPSPTNVLTFQIEYYDLAGTLLNGPPPVITLQPEASYNEQATPLTLGTPAGFGSARIVSTNGEKLVGATVHHTYTIASAADPVTDPDFLVPGASSMQQLQKRQNAKTELFLGPLPVTNTSPSNFLNGNLPFWWVMNPNPTPNVVTIQVTSAGGAVLPPTTVTIPAYATYLDLSLWNILVSVYASSPAFGFSDDFSVSVRSRSGLALIGEAMLTDFFDDGDGDGDGFQENLVAGGRFRWGSVMMANTPSRVLTNPELVYQAGGPPVETLMGIHNAGSSNIGPVRIEYRDRNGTLLGTDNLNPFPGGAMARIGPGLAASPNYPAPGVFAGWVRITALCGDDLVGWTMREVLEEGPFQFRKVYGEALEGANGQEPGNGFAVTVGGQTRTRKVSPLLQVDPGFFWPSYTTFVNDSVSNLGPYEFRFFDFAGTNIGFGAFAGLPWARTSFTYEDPLIFFGVFAQGSGRVDHTSGSVQGIDAIGDPLREWLLLAFP